MKKKLSSFIAVLFLIFTSASFAETYWSNSKDGPYSIQDAINKLDGKKLDPLEGVWFTDGMGTVAIFKDQDPKLGNVFKMYIIDGEGSAAMFNRTWEATYIQSSPGYYKFFHRVWYTNSNREIVKLRTQTGYTTLKKSSNKFQTRYDNLSESGRKMDGYYTRVWPQNISSYNFKFEPTKTKEFKNDEPNNSKIEKNKKNQFNFKNYWWVIVLLALGTFFLYTTTVKKPKINFMKKKKSKQRGRIAKYWAGEESLAFSFWGVSTIGVIVFQIPNYILIGMGDAYFDNLSNISLLIYALYIISLIIYLVIAYVGCWRSAARYIKENLKKKKSAFWGYTTYLLIVLSVIRSFGKFLSEI